MKKGLYFAVFITGTVLGAAAVWQYAKKKYEQIAKEEIDSVKEVFSKKEENVSEEKETYSRKMADQAKEKPEVKEYASILQKKGYSKYSRKENDEIYVIAPEEFGSYEDYDQISFTYYADGVLADDNDEQIYDIYEVIGNALEHFGEYEEDSVFVRCEKRKCDYEILLDERMYRDVIQTKPHQMEEE